MNKAKCSSVHFCTPLFQHILWFIKCVGREALLWWKDRVKSKQNYSDAPCFSSNIKSLWRMRVRPSHITWLRQRHTDKWPLETRRQCVSISYISIYLMHLIQLYAGKNILHIKMSSRHQNMEDIVFLSFVKFTNI